MHRYLLSTVASLVVGFSAMAQQPVPPSTAPLPQQTDTVKPVVTIRHLYASKKHPQGNIYYGVTNTGDLVEMLSPLTLGGIIDNDFLHDVDASKKPHHVLVDMKTATLDIAADVRSPLPRGNTYFMLIPPHPDSAAMRADLGTEVKALPMPNRPKPGNKPAP